MENFDFSKLKTNKCKVTFTKVDGTERVMTCTTDFNFIPEENHPTGNSTKKYKENVHRVFDLEKNAWRSFKEETVKSFEVLN